MRIGDILVAKDLLTPEDVAEGLQIQRLKGGSLGECLAALGKVSREDIERALAQPPRSPRSVAETGLSVATLLNLVTKVIAATGEATEKSLSASLKLPSAVIREVMEEANKRRLIESLGSTFATSGMSIIRYGLTMTGAAWAKQAMEQNEYVGPAPISLDAFRERVTAQRIADERIGRMSLQDAFGDLQITEALMRELGPAVNSGRSILLYGPPGNGKTSIGERIGRLFRGIVFLPYCIEVEGQIIRFFDPVVHRPLEANAGAGNLRRDDLDVRWVACWRPFVVAGGELTLEMLDLKYDENAKFYEAPLHIKALGGIFLIDDFGRQLVSPEELLNRWIVPMESRVEYLKLHTGKTFDLPFDELVIFSTNLSPAALMDGAFLRRIPYKIEIGGPSANDYRRIFQGACVKNGVSPEQEMIEAVIRDLTVHNDFPLASFQPKFLIDQVVAAARFDGVEPALTPDYLTLGLNNLHTRDTPGFRALPALDDDAQADSVAQAA
jgi:hypothetical protein